jgi:hypothetical protein
MKISTVVGRAALVLAMGTALLAATTSAASAQPQPASQPAAFGAGTGPASIADGIQPAAVDCPANGRTSTAGPEYNCLVFPSGGAPVCATGHAGCVVIGHLHQGTNWVTCVALADANPSPPGTSYHSNYWLWTLSDKDSAGNSHWGWVPATFIHGGVRPSGPPAC